MAKQAPRSKNASSPAEQTELLRPKVSFAQELEDRATKGDGLLQRNVTTRIELGAWHADVTTWDEYNRTLISRAFTTTAPSEAYKGYRAIVMGGRETLQGAVKDEFDFLQRQVRKLRSLSDQLDLYETRQAAAAASFGSAEDERKAVFIVHGHADGKKLEVAKVVSQVTGREAVILHELPDSGRTIIEKLENAASTVEFAVVLLTADDVGGKRDSEAANPRARQNVIFELGLFIGLIGRNRVAVLYEDGVELPSDMSGVLYTSFNEGWQVKLGREMKAAGTTVDLNGLI